MCLEPCNAANTTQHNTPPNANHPKPYSVRRTPSPSCAFALDPAGLSCPLGRRFLEEAPLYEPPSFERHRVNRRRAMSTLARAEAQGAWMVMQPARGVCSAQRGADDGAGAKAFD